MKEKFNIEGMSCSACSSSIQKAVGNLKGVKDVTVNLLSNYMIVDYDEKIISSKDIENKVKSIGYIAICENNENHKDFKNFNDEYYKKESYELKKRVIFSFIFLIFLMYVSMGYMFGFYTFDFLKGYKNAINFTFTQFLLTLPIMYINRKYYIRGFKALIKRNANMDSLVAISSMASVIFGIYVIYKLSFALRDYDYETLKRYYHNIYFESAGMILTLITFGKYLESISKNKTNDAVKKLMDLSAKKAIVIRNGKEIEIDVDKIEKNDILVVKQGFSVCADGKIIEGSGLFDTSSITGESFPLEKTVGDFVLASSILKEGYVKVLSQKVKDETVFSKIIKLVEQANNTKPKIAKIVDKVAYFFVPIVIMIAIITFLVWILLGRRFEFALEMAISVLVISCPCALGLATPVAIMVATGKSARLGILVKTSQSLESLKNVDVVVFDKTATLTEGKFTITNIISNNMEKRKLLEILYSLESKSQHPLAISICEYAKRENITTLDVSNFESKIGYGISGIIEGKKYFLGNLKYIVNDYNLPKEFYNYFKKFSLEAKSVMFLKNEEEILALIAIADKIKQTSKETIDILKSMNIKTIMLTGDNENVAKNISEKLNLDEFFHSLLPEDKQKIIKKLLSENKKVIMVGDGINDSPSLSLATVGISVRNGTDIAIESSDVVLISDDMKSIINLINLAKKTIRNIKENLFWAFIYNILLIPLAAGVLYIPFKIRLNPMIASFSMSLSSLFVVLNALRLNRFKGLDMKKDKQKEDKFENVEFKKINIKEKIKKEGVNMKKIVIIEGMMCDHCKKRIEKEFYKLEDVVDAKVDLEKKSLTLESKNEISDEKIKEIIKNLDYKFIKFI